MKKIFKIILIIILILTFAGIFFIIKNNQNNQTPTGSAETLEYKNIGRNFLLRYPKDLKVKEYDEKDTTYTIVFSDDTGEKSFQVFFTPYLGNTITQSRILKDVPNGKFTKPVEIVIGGSIHSLAFWSEGELGEMREIWFIHDGYLFEITTYKELDSWLAEIMDSWKFFQINPAGGN